MGDRIGDQVALESVRNVCGNRSVAARNSIGTIGPAGGSASPAPRNNYQTRRARTCWNRDDAVGAPGGGTGPTSAASAAKQRVYDARSARTAAAAAAGLEALAKLHEEGDEPHAAALERLKRELGDGIESIDLLFSL